MSKKVVLEWTQVQQTELEKLASEYCDIDSQIKALNEKKATLKSSIGKLMDHYDQKKVLTESYSVSYIHVDGSRTFNSEKAKAKLIELKVELDDTFYKFGKASERLDIKKIETVDSSKDDEHRVKVTLDDLQI